MVKVRLTILICLGFFSCAKSNTAHLDDNSTFFPNKIWYLVEDGNTAKSFYPDQANAIKNLENDWIETSKRSFSFGFAPRPIWMCIEAQNLTEENLLVLEFGNPHVDEVLLYEEGASEPFLRAGDLIPHSQWDLYSKSVAVKLPWQKGLQKRIFARIHSTSSLYLALKLYTLPAFEFKENRENSVIGFFYGTIVIMVIYNLFIYFILKDISYILYSFSILANLLVQCFINGISNDLFTPDDPSIHNRLGSVFVCVSAICGWSFAIQFLNCKTYLPKAHLILRGLTGIVILYLLLVINVLPLQIITRYTQMVAQIFVGSVFLVAFLSIKAGNKQAKLFLLGWSVLLIGILLFTFMQSGIVPSNWITVYSNQIGSTLEAGILSLALADKINQLKEEKAEAQAEAVATLEEKVFARTKELDESLQIIRKDLNVAKKIQQNLFSPPRIKDNRLEFETYYKSMTEVGGDFYDISQIDKDRFRFCVADATGHGIQAALITMAIKSEYESLKAVHDLPNELLAHLNRIFFHKYSMLQTIFTCAICDIDLKQKKLIFASAGHPDQYLLSNQEIHSLSRTGRILGMVSNSEFSNIELSIKPTDRIYLFSDGLLEEFNERREIFGEDRLKSMILAKRDLPLQEGVSLLTLQLNQFLGNQGIQDDITIIACEIKNNEA